MVTLSRNDGEDMGWWDERSYDSPAGILNLVAQSLCAVAGTYGVGGSPLGIGFDGTNIWVANVTNNTVSKIRA